MRKEIEKELYRIYDHDHFDAGLLITWRNERGFSAGWIARTAGLRLEEYFDIENRVVKPPLKLMLKICRLLKIRLEDLFW
jgi:DNA-binding XRE family transcriptional regulator